MLDFAVTQPQVTGEDNTAAKIRMIAPELASHARIVRDIVDRHKSTLIFVNTRQAAEVLGSLFAAVTLACIMGRYRERHALRQKTNSKPARKEV